MLVLLFKDKKKKVDISDLTKITKYVLYGLYYPYGISHEELCLFSTKEEAEIMLKVKKSIHGGHHSVNTYEFLEENVPSFYLTAKECCKKFLIVNTYLNYFDNV